MLGRSQAIDKTQRHLTPKDKQSLVGIVYHVILDHSDPILDDYNIVKEDKSAYVGSVIYRLETELNKPDDDLSFAFPKHLSFNRLPVKNEEVHIIKSPGGGAYYDITSHSSYPNITSGDTVINDSSVLDKDTKQNTEGYNRVIKTGIARSSLSERSDYDNFGNYFKFQPSLHKLKLYEGDTIIQSRFGQSIRFSGYNNNERSMSPTIIIRNGESSVSQNEDEGKTVDEDINRDGSVIVMGSGDYLLPFNPGISDGSGRNDFETNPASFKNYPNKLIGNQMLLNSDRIILSARSGEFILYSKKNYGFISDGGMSIDNRLGIDINVGDNVNVSTNNSDININTGSGKINLGDTDLEPILKGNTLVNLLEELLDEISKQVFLTPAGPTSVGPTNLPKFNTIRNKLKMALSKLNSTS
jgi:hypothetical protein